MTYAASLLIAAIAALPAFGIAAWISLAMARADEDLLSLVNSGGIGWAR